MFLKTIFNVICPRSVEPMKFLRKMNDAQLYTCFQCYKSWLGKHGQLTAIKLETK